MNQYISEFITEDEKYIVKSAVTEIICKNKKIKLFTHFGIEIFDNKTQQWQAKVCKVDPNTNSLCFIGDNGVKYLLNELKDYNEKLVDNLFAMQNTISEILVSYSKEDYTAEQALEKIKTVIDKNYVSKRKYIN